jgi:hypothetical protein
VRRSQPLRSIAATVGMATLWMSNPAAASAAAAADPATNATTQQLIASSSMWLRSAADVASGSIPVSPLDLALSFALVLGVMVGLQNLKSSLPIA